MECTVYDNRLHTHLDLLGLIFNDDLVFLQGTLQLFVPLQQRLAQLGGQLEICKDTNRKRDIQLLFHLIT